MSWSAPRLALLMQSLVAKELKIRYKRSVLGFAWFLLKPVFSMIVFSVVFTRILRFGGSIEHYALFLLCGLLPWNFFSASLSASTGSLLDNQKIIRSIYFPRLALPIASVLANAVHLVLALVVLGVALAAFGHVPGPSMLALPLVLVLFVAMTCGLSLLICVGNVLYRDVAQVVEVLLLAWFYASPIIYPLSGEIPISPRVLSALRFNPVAGAMEIFHSLFHSGSWPASWCWVSLSCWAFGLLLVGVLVFRKAEPSVVKEL
ncbi:ABC transporter permease [Candidatus Fermentibacterales bacterium]|nr:ABC transporter permease [Candidatus Fermentibacterales bacterium]